VSSSESSKLAVEEYNNPVEQQYAGSMGVFGVGTYALLAVVYDSHVEDRFFTPLVCDLSKLTSSSLGNTMKANSERMKMINFQYNKDTSALMAQAHLGHGHGKQVYIYRYVYVYI
jgi:hypothetical protein